MVKTGLSLPGREFGRRFEAQQAASQTLWIMGGAVAVLMLLLLSTSFGSTRAALLVMANLPLSLIGGIIAIYVTESPSIAANTLALAGIGSAHYQAPVISIASMVGFVTLFGIAVRNGILLVNHYAYLMHKEGRPLHEAIIRRPEADASPGSRTQRTSLVRFVALAQISNW